MIIRLQVFEQTLSIIDTGAIPRKGSKDYLILQFTFSSDWKDLDKLCYLQRGEVSQPIDMVDNLVEVPEWFTQQDSFDVTLFGKSGSQEVPTNVVSLRLEKSNTLWEQNAPEPQPSWLAKVIDLNNHPPIPGDNGYWMLWDTDSGAYVESDLPLPAGGSGGISTTAKNLLITILRSGVYTDDQSANITALDTALGGGTTEPEKPDVPVETTYAISNELINCTTSNSATSVKENVAYSATLTANDGYTLTGGTVTITMGGVDITATAYADGVISIAAVTGDVEIFASAVVVQAEAALPEDGLIGYFDFRTTTYNNAGSGGSTTIAPTKGSGQLFAWANNSISAQNEYGLKPANARQWQYDKNGGTTQTALGNAFTVIQLTYGEAPKFGFNYNNTTPRWTFYPKYINTSGSTTAAAEVNGGNFNSDSSADYNFTVVRADGATLTEIFDTSRTTYNGGDIDGFSRWLDTPYGNLANTGDNKYCTAMAIYNRAMTDTEIEAAREFMNTLEVTA